MSASPILSIYSVTLAEISNKTMHLPIQISRDGKIVETKALIDSGAGGTFMDQNFARKHQLPLEKLEEPLVVFNMDGTQNKRGTITHYMELNIIFGSRTRKTCFLISGLGKQHLIFGFPWLETENPIIDWKRGTLEWKRTPLKFKFQGRPTPITEIIDQTLSEDPDSPPPKEDNDPSDLITSISTMSPSEPDLYIQAKATAATTLAQQEKKVAIPLEELVPKEYHAYLHLFDKKSSERFPKSRSWDHKIEMKADFQPKVFKKYNLSNRRRWTNSLTRTWRRDISFHSNLRWHLLSSLSVRKMEVSDHARTIDI